MWYYLYMGMGTSANSVITVEQDFVKEICSVELEEFLTQLENESVELDDFAYSANGEDFSQYNNNLVESYLELVNKFLEKTGLNISLFHHSEDEGDRYDDFFGSVWCIDYSDVYVLSEKAEKIKDKISHKYFTIFG